MYYFALLDIHWREGAKPDYPEKIPWSIGDIDSHETQVKLLCRQGLIVFNSKNTYAESRKATTNRGKKKLVKKLLRYGSTVMQA